MTSNCGFSNGVMYARNVDFSGELEVEPTILENGQLLIGANTAPFIRPGHLTSLDSSVTITEGAGTIDLSVGEFGALTFDADSGSASPIANTLHLSGSHGLNTSAATDVVTFAIDNAITLGDLANLGTSDALNAETGNVTLLAGNLNLAAYAGMANIGRIAFWDTDSAQYIPSIWTDNSNWFCGFLSNASGSTFSPSCNRNTTLGTQSLQYLGSVDNGDDNVAVGYKSLYVLGQNGGNTAVGSNALYLLPSGSNNLALGNQAGSSLTGFESDNIYLSNIGVVGDNDTIRIGTEGTQNRAFLAGVSGVSVANQVIVSMNTSNGQLGNLTLTSTDSSISIDASSPGTINLAVASIATDLTIHTDSGNAVSVAGALTFAGTHGLNSSGSGSTVTYAVDNTLTLGDLSPVSVGVPSLTLQTGDVHIVHGFLDMPNTVDGFQGAITFDNGMFGVSSIYSDCINNNWFCGFGVNIGGPYILTGTNNEFFGQSALNFATGSNNITMGATALALAGAGSACDNNTAIGTASLSNVLTCSGNTALGYSAGSNYTSTESNNVVISSQGVIGDAGVIRIGSGSQTSAYIAGINGSSLSSASIVAIDTTSGQLAAAHLTSNDSSISIDVSTPGTINLTTSGGGGSGNLPYTDESSDFTAAVNNGYFVVSTATATLPASPTQGQIVSIVSQSLGPTTILANSGQVIVIGSAVSGVGGTAVNSTLGASVHLVYRDVSGTWIATSVIGTWIIT